MNYAISKTLALGFDEALSKVTAGLKDEGFGVLTTIDVKETLKTKLNIDFGRYIILGACNPPIAHRALVAEEQIGLLLPCNVVVYEKEESTVVAAFDPMIMVSLTGNPQINSIAEEVHARLKRVIDRM